MIKIDEKQQKILSILLRKGDLRSSEIHSALESAGDDGSLVTVKRTLKEMVDSGYLAIGGVGPSTSYSVLPIGRLFADIDAHAYCAEEPDIRFGLSSYNFDLLSAIPDDIFLEQEQKNIDEATNEYERRTKDLSQTLHKKELERLIIELSWKSSKIEGNTYTLLDTEKLILEDKEAPGHSKEETRMILNHKDAFSFVYENRTEFKTVTRANTEKLHAILVKDMNVGVGLRQKAVGVVGSKYRPLDISFQISEAFNVLVNTVAKIENPAAKALVALLGISYIQPFEDGNKRTSRIMANALLLAHGMAPLSYRSVNENDYREAMLVFYEVNSLVAFKKIFVEQYDFAAKNYAVK